jgi:dihydrofolate reductase
MTISSIVAVSENNVIGKDNRLIWRLPIDVKFFKDKTTGHCVITGRRNYESIPDSFRPLPNRTNIVVTRDKEYKAPGAVVVNSIEDALQVARKKNETECFIIGGGEIFEQTLNITDKVYLTRVHHSFEGDVFFKNLEPGKWKLVSETYYPVDEKHLYSFTIQEWVKVGGLVE